MRQEMPQSLMAPPADTGGAPAPKPASTPQVRRASPSPRIQQRPGPAGASPAAGRPPMSAQQPREIPTIGK
jgi:hypothetical protein